MADLTDIVEAEETHGYDSTILPLLEELRQYRIGAEMPYHSPTNTRIRKLESELGATKLQREQLKAELKQASKLNEQYRKQLDAEETTPFQNWFQHIHPELFKTITVEFK